MVRGISGLAPRCCRSTNEVIVVKLEITAKVYPDPEIPGDDPSPA